MPRLLIVVTLKIYGVWRHAVGFDPLGEDQRVIFREVGGDLACLLQESKSGKTDDEDKRTDIREMTTPRLTEAVATLSKITDFDEIYAAAHDRRVDWAAFNAAEHVGDRLKGWVDFTHENEKGINVDVFAALKSFTAAPSPETFQAAVEVIGRKVPLAAERFDPAVAFGAHKHTLVRWLKSLDLSLEGLEESGFRAADVQEVAAEYETDAPQFISRLRDMVYVREGNLASLKDGALAGTADGTRRDEIENGWREVERCLPTGSNDLLYTAEDGAVLNVSAVLQDVTTAEGLRKLAGTRKCQLFKEWYSKLNSSLDKVFEAATAGGRGRGEARAGAEAKRE